MRSPIYRTAVLLLVFVAGSLAVTITGCKKEKKAEVMPEYRTSATIKDIMDSIVDPDADFLWDSVSTITTKKGVVVNAPRTEADWAEERHRVIAAVANGNFNHSDLRDG